MAVLWVNFFIVFISSFFSRYFSRPMEGAITYIKPNKLLIFFSISSLVLVSGLRNNIGDTFFYMHSYRIGDFSLENFKFEAEFGFQFLQSILHLISSDPQILIFTTALLTNLLIVVTLYKYSRKIELGLFVYIAAGMYTVSMNGIRQYLAAAIIFAATKYILEGNFKKFALVVLLASTIHQSSLIFLPIYFVVRRKAWTKTTFVILLVGVGMAAGFNEFSKFLFSAIEDTKYRGYSNFDEGGSSFLRVLVTGAPLIVAYLGRDKLRELWPKSDYIVNLTLLGVVFIIVATQNWIFARFQIYFGLYSLILISWVIVLFKKQYRKLVYYAIISLYFLYFYYEQVIALNIQYRSDFIQL
jgi:transmembrane protein EpsG